MAIVKFFKNLVDSFFSLLGYEPKKTKIFIATDNDLKKMRNIEKEEIIHKISSLEKKINEYNKNHIVNAEIQNELILNLTTATEILINMLDETKLISMSENASTIEDQEKIKPLFSLNAITNDNIEFLEQLKKKMN